MKARALTTFPSARAPRPLQFGCGRRLTSSINAGSSAITRSGCASRRSKSAGLRITPILIASAIPSTSSRLPSAGGRSCGLR
eukprot:5663058-Prymnesium_polylepis.1